MRTGSTGTSSWTVRALHPGGGYGGYYTSDLPGDRYADPALAEVHTDYGKRVKRWGISVWLGHLGVGGRVHTRGDFGGSRRGERKRRSRAAISLAPGTGVNGRSSEAGADEYDTTGVKDYKRIR
jgi:hypothetical protein